MKKILTICGVLAVACVNAQHTSGYVDRGLIRLQGNLGASKSPQGGPTNMYLTGDIDYYVSPGISVRGAMYLFLGGFGEEVSFKDRHQGYLGASFHIPTGRQIDPYVGIQPGYAICRMAPNYVEPNPAYSTYSIVPMIGVHTGFNYYASRFFNLFAHIQYNHGTAYIPGGAVAMDEVALTFGLGYMLWARDGKWSFRKPGN